jgi:large subunit ribosomal protein L35
MPKMKTHRGAAKRFKMTASGKVKYKHAYLRHCLEHKSKVTKKKLSKPGYLKECDARHVRRLLGKG